MNASLEQWMDQATRSLAPESARRVREEIQEHHNSAVASGASEADAVASLGDARRANREYRKVLLTKADVKWLAFVKRRGEGRGPHFPLYVILATWLIDTTVRSLQGSPDGASPLLPMTLLTAVLDVPRWVSIDTKLRSFVYRTLRWAGITFVLVVFAKAGSWPPMLFIYAVFVWAAYKDYVLRRKLPVKEWPKELHL